MNGLDRRDFFRIGSLGLAAGLGVLTLAGDAQPTEASGQAEDFLTANSIEIAPAVLPPKFQPTEDNILGPYHRKGAPFRGLITPPLEPGDVLVVRGRVWGFDSKQPLAGATAPGFRWPDGRRSTTPWASTPQPSPT